MTTLEILLEVKTRINKKEQYRWWRKRGWGNKYHAYSNMTRIRKACEKPNVVYSFHSICKNGKITGFPPPVFRTAAAIPWTVEYPVKVLFGLGYGN